ncbi:MAG: hypothetical protein QM784_05310 [Polyangiaceae bacterium]
MRRLTSSAIALAMICASRYGQAKTTDVATRFAEMELAASRAKDDSKRSELEAERNTLAQLWCDQTAGYVRRRLDEKQVTEARLVATEGLAEIIKHPSLGVCTQSLDGLLSEALQEELAIGEADAQNGLLLLAIERGRSLKSARSSDVRVDEALRRWENEGKTSARAFANEAQTANRAGAELLARRMEEAAGESSTSKSIEETVRERVSRQPRYVLSGAECTLLGLGRLPTNPGAPMDMEIHVDECKLDVQTTDRDESYTYDVEVPYTYEEKVGEDCTTEKSRHFGKSDVTGKMDWIESSTRVCNPRTTTKTGYKTERRTGIRTVTHVVTSLSFRGTVVVSETQERHPFDVRDSFDDQKYVTPQGSRSLTGEGPDRMAQATVATLAPIIEDVLSRERNRLGREQLERAKSARASGAWLEMEDAVLHASVAGIGPTDELVAKVAERHRLTNEQARALINGNRLPSTIAVSGDRIARIPEAHWTEEKEKLINDRAVEHFIYSHLALLYGRPKDGVETGRFGVALGATLHSPVRDVIVPSMLVSFRVGLDHDIRFLYDLHVGLGGGSRLGPVQLRLYGTGGFDRVSMGEHHELPSAWTYGGEGHLDFELSRFTNVGFEGLLQKRTSGPTDALLEKRLRAKFMLLGEDLTGYSFGAQVEDYGIGRIYGVFIGSD